MCPFTPDAIYHMRRITCLLPKKVHEPSYTHPLHLLKAFTSLITVWLERDLRGMGYTYHTNLSSYLLYISSLLSHMWCGSIKSLNHVRLSYFISAYTPDLDFHLVSPPPHPLPCHNWLSI